MPYQGCNFLNFGFGNYLISYFILAILVVSSLLILKKSNLLKHIKQKARENTNPVDILKERLAKGEITKEEFNNLIDKIK